MLLENLVIAILVLVGLLFLFQIEIYRNVLIVTTNYMPETPPPQQLRLPTSFLTPSGTN